MKIPKLEPGDAVEIIWANASVYENGAWVGENQYVHDPDDVFIKTHSTYLGISRGFIKLCADRYAADGLVGKIARGFDLPIGCIKEIHKLIRDKK